VIALYRWYYLLYNICRMNSSFEEEIHPVNESFSVEPNEDTEQYQCDICNYTTVYKHNLTRYIRNHRATLSPDSSSVTNVSDQCSRQFKSKYGLNLHYNNKHANVFRFKRYVSEQRKKVIYGREKHRNRRNKSVEQKKSKREEK